MPKQIGNGFQAHVSLMELRGESVTKQMYASRLQSAAGHGSAHGAAHMMRPQRLTQPCAMSDKKCR
jgi:hypothetical protein